MLTKVFTPAMGDTQTSRMTPCLQCRVMVPYRTNNRIYCPTCSHERRRESQRKAAEVQRRKHGIAPFKGTEAKCDGCAAPIVLTTIKHRFCEQCGKQAALDRARETSFNKSRTLGLRQFGEILACAHCGADFIYQNPKDTYCEPCSVLSKANKLPAARVTRSKWHKDKLKTDPMFGINARMRQGIRCSLKDGKAGRSWESLVGYTAQDLMRHLERQFTKGMSWERWPEIHIDHITPLSAYNFTSAEDPEFRAAYSLSNLRPLWGAENIQKKDKRLFLL